MDYRILTVNKEFFKNRYFIVSSDELRIFYENFYGFTDDMGILNIPNVDIEKTIRMHSGDARIWTKEGWYINLEGNFMFMNCHNLPIYNIYEWFREFIPSLWDKHTVYDMEKDWAEGIGTPGKNYKYKFFTELNK